MRIIYALSIQLIVIVLALSALAANVTIPYKFVSGTTAKASEVNGNFTALATAIENIPAGPQGPQGPQGLQGSVGLQGSIGPQGPAGQSRASSGSRLKSRYLEGSDGSGMFAGFWDSQLSTSCYFANASDGTLRCVPTNMVYVGSFFSDPSCTNEIAFTNGSLCPTPSYVMKSLAQYCSTDGNVFPIAIYPIISQYNGTAYYKSTGCQIWTVTGYTFFTFGAEIPPTDFVSAVYVTK